MTIKLGNIKILFGYNFRNVQQICGDPEISPANSSRINYPSQLHHNTSVDHNNLANDKMNKIPQMKTFLDQRTQRNFTKKQVSPIGHPGKIGRPVMDKGDGKSYFQENIQVPGNSLELVTFDKRRNLTNDKRSKLIYLPCTSKVSKSTEYITNLKTSPNQSPKIDTPCHMGCVGTPTSRSPSGRSVFRDETLQVMSAQVSPKIGVFRKITTEN